MRTAETRQFPPLMVPDLDAPHLDVSPYLIAIIALLGCRFADHISARLAMVSGFVLAAWDRWAVVGSPPPGPFFGRSQATPPPISRARLLLGKALRGRLMFETGYRAPRTSEIEWGGRG